MAEIPVLPVITAFLDPDKFVEEMVDSILA